MNSCWWGDVGGGRGRGFASHAPLTDVYAMRMLQRYTAARPKKGDCKRNTTTGNGMSVCVDRVMCNTCHNPVHACMSVQLNYDELTTGVSATCLYSGEYDVCMYVCMYLCLKHLIRRSVGNCTFTLPSRSRHFKVMDTSQQITEERACCLHTYDAICTRRLR